jgi:hypothetical protein
MAIPVNPLEYIGKAMIACRTGNPRAIWVQRFGAYKPHPAT